MPKLIGLMLLVFSMPLLADNLDGWSLKITPTVGGVVSGTPVTLGEFTDAIDGFDSKYDAPILTMSSEVEVYFNRAGWEKKDTKFWYDIQGLGAEKLWVLTASSSLLGKTYRLDWDSSVVPIGHTVVLRDWTSGQSVDMAAASFYEFINTMPGPHLFTVKVGYPAIDACPLEMEGAAFGLDFDGDGCRDVSGVNLSIAASAEVATVHVGQEAVYAVTVSNQGDINADNVILEAQLDRDVTFVRATKSCVYSAAEHLLRCEIGNVPRGSFSDMEIVLEPTAEGTVTHRLEVETPLPGDPFYADNNVTVETKVVAALSGLPGGAAGGGPAGGGSFSGWSLMVLLLAALFCRAGIQLPVRNQVNSS